MSITTYSELTTAVKNWIARDDLDTYLDDIVMLGEKWIYRHARVRAMEEPFNETMVSGIITLPSDYVEMKSAYIDRTPIQWLDRKSLTWIYSSYPSRVSEKCPKFFANNGNTLEFGPFPDMEYTVKGTYYKRFAPLSAELNSLFTDNPDLFLFAALSEAELFIQNDVRVPVWTAKRNQILDDVNGEDSKERFSGGPLRMVAQ